MTTLSSVEEQQRQHHMDSVGQIEYQRIDSHDTNNNQVEYFKFGGHEYADSAMQPLKQGATHQTDDTSAMQQRLSTEEEEEIEGNRHSKRMGDIDNDESSEYQHSSASKPDQANQMMQPLYHGNLMQALPHGNNTDLESITRSKPLLMNQHSLEEEQMAAINQSEIYKAHIVLQQQREANPTQSSFEGYQTDMTYASNNNPASTYYDNTQVETRQEEQDNQDFSRVTQVCQDKRQAAGKKSACTFIEYTEVFVWGEDKSGQLGIDSQLQSPQQQNSSELGVHYRRPDYIPIPRSCSFNIVIKQVSCGESHSAILTAQGHLYMMGSNLMGQLGVNTVGPSPEVERQLHSLSPAQIEALYSAGSPILVESLKGINVEQVSCGADFTTVICRVANLNEPHIQPKAEVFAWGNNSSGQLGDGQLPKSNLPLRVDAFDVLEEEIIQVSCGGSHVLYLTSDRDVISCGSNQYGQCGFDPEECSQTSTPFKVAAFDGVCVAQVSAGYEHSLFLTEDGHVYAGGSNIDLQLGVGDNFERTQTPVHVQAIEHTKVVRVESSFYSAAINDQGQLYQWGRGVWGETPFPQQIMTISNPVIDISVGRDLGMAIDNQGLAWSWGSNINGELGVGDSEPRVHPFPILNLKGKLVTKAHCGHNFTICLGNNIRKEIPAADNNLPSISEAQQIPAGNGHEQRKKRITKKKKSSNNDPQKKRSTSTRPHTSQTYGKYVNEPSHLLPLQKRQQRNLAEVRNHSFGAPPTNNSRTSSVERSTSAGAIPNNRKASRNPSNKRVQQERSLNNLSQKYGNNNISTSMSQKQNHGQLSYHAQPMQIVTSQSHEKNSRLMTEQEASSRIKSPTAQSQMLAGKPQTTNGDYESGRQPPMSNEIDVSKTLGKLKGQVKSLKDENRAMKQELNSKNNVIDKLEKTVHKLQTDDSHQREVQELQGDVKRSEMKLRKMKERRNFYRGEKDSLKVKVNEMQKDNEALFDQVAKMQEQSHNHRDENAKLQTKLKNTEKQLDTVYKDLTHVQEHSKSIKGKNEQFEKEFQSHIRYQEAKVTDLEGQLKFESDQRNKMAEEIVRLEKLVKSREDYMVSLENESIYLRKEIKASKFNNQKQGYIGFVSNLTQLRQSRDRSHNRVEQLSAERRPVNLSNQNSFVPVKLERGYDEYPQRDANSTSLGRKTSNQATKAEVPEPPSQIFSQRQESSMDARSRLMMSDLHREQPQRKQSPFQGINSLRKQDNRVSNITSPLRSTQLSSAKHQIAKQQTVSQQVQRENPSRDHSKMDDETTQLQDKQLHHTISSHLSELIEDKTLDQRNQSHIKVNMALSQNHQLAEDQSTTFKDNNKSMMTETVLAVVPLEDNEDGHQQKVLMTEPHIQETSSNILEQSRPEQQQQLADNSMVIQQQMSDLAHRQHEAVAEAERNISRGTGINSSSFTEQSRKTPEMASGSQQTRKVSTMIPLGAPKGDGDLRDKYKQMLMAKLDMKTIQRRKRQEQSSEP